VLSAENSPRVNVHAADLPFSVNPCAAALDQEQHDQDTNYAGYDANNRDIVHGWTSFLS